MKSRRATHKETKDKIKWTEEHTVCSAGEKIVSDITDCIGYLGLLGFMVQIYDTMCNTIKEINE